MEAIAPEKQAPKERPVLFTAEEVRATQDGRQTQFRRVVKPQPQLGVHNATGYDGRQWWAWHGGTTRAPEEHYWQPHETPGVPLRCCPYGVPGDRIYVKETFALSIRDPETFEPDSRSPYDWDPPVYKADNPTVSWSLDSVVDGKLVSEPLDKPPWRPSVHMPRWASRILLEVTDVRVERVQDITQEEAEEEGSYLAKCPCLPPARNPIESLFKQSWCQVHGQEFSNLWDSRHAKRGHGWDVNPWVWVVGFRVLDV